MKFNQFYSYTIFDEGIMKQPEFGLLVDFDYINTELIIQ